MSDVRLIDANRFKRFLQALCKAGAPYDEVIQLLDKESTAYNPDKVVEEIKAQFGCKDCEYVDEFQHPACNECAELEVINDICDIVKRGGLE